MGCWRCSWVTVVTWANVAGKLPPLMDLTAALRMLGEAPRTCGLGYSRATAAQEMPK
jgi:hypothetical protein